MHVSISNFRGLADLRANIAPILLLAGVNGAGKSSACVAIAAAASGAPLPFDGLTKKTAGLLVRDGADLATVHLEDVGRSATASWPAADRGSAGGWRDISAVAAGLVDMASLKPAERAALLIDLIGATPTADDLREAMTKEEVPKDIADEAVKQITRGWDPAHAWFKDAGAKLKGRWEQVTSARFGKAKVVGWRPAEWVVTMEGATADDLQTLVADAEAQYQEANKRAGVSKAQLDAWRGLADTASQLRGELVAAETDHTNEVTRAKLFTDALEAKGARPQPGAEPLMCPCCDAGVRLKDGKLVAADPHDFAELSGAADDWDRAKVMSDRAIERRDIALNYVRAAERKLEAATQAQDHLLAVAAGEGAATEEEVSEARAAMEKARKMLEMRHKITEATALATKTQHVQTIIDILDRTGLRQTKLTEALGTFNGQLVQACSSAGWSPVHVDADMGVTYGGRPISLCSAGEQYRARISLQLSIAGYEKAALVVIDGADILDKAGRNGLFRVLDDLGFRAVIGMTMLRKEDMPDLKRAGIGQSIWIEGGVGGVRVKEAA